MFDCGKSRLAGTVAVMLLLAASGRVGATEKAAPSAASTAPKTGVPVAEPKAEQKAEPKAEPASTKNLADAKAPAKNDARATESAPPPSGKGTPPEAATDGDKDAKAPPKSPAKALEKRKAVAGKETKPKIGEGPSPASPPPLTVSGLRDEIRREPASLATDPSSPPRTKLEQMLVEIAKAREALRDDTARLEGMMSENDGAAATGATPGAAPGPGSAKPAAKNPLDVLAKALRGIKPELAGPIVSRLDKRLAATVLLRMPPVDAGKIMGALKPDTAAELATQISLRMPSAEAKR